MIPVDLFLHVPNPPICFFPVWAALIAASQEPDPEDITSNTQWSIAYNNTDLTADIVLRRHWNDITHYGLTTNET